MAGDTMRPMRTWTGPSFRGEGLVGNKVVRRYRDATGKHTVIQPEEPVIPDGVVELRVHGVNGGTPEQNLHDPAPVRVSGDDTAGFYRRRRELHSGPPRTVEAYNWSSINSKKSIRAWWLVLFPFAAANFAGWLLPNGMGDRSRRLAQVVVRLIGLATTVIAILGMALIFVDLIGVQCAFLDDCTTDFTWGWIGSIAAWGPLDNDPRRLAVAYSLLPALALLVLWLLGKRSSRYEKYGAAIPRNEPDGKPHKDPIGERIDGVRLDRAEFWQAPDVVYVQAWLHVTAALSALTAAMAIALRELDPGTNSAAETVVAVGKHHHTLQAAAFAGIAVVLLSAAAVVAVSWMKQIPRRLLRKKDKAFWLPRWSWLPAGTALGLFAWVGYLGWTQDPVGDSVLDGPPLEAFRNGLIVASVSAILLVLGLAFLVGAWRLSVFALLIGPAVFVVTARQGDGYLVGDESVAAWLWFQALVAVGGILIYRLRTSDGGLSDDEGAHHHNPVWIYGTTAVVAMGSLAVAVRSSGLVLIISAAAPVAYLALQFVTQIARGHDYPQKEKMREGPAAVVAGLGLTSVLTIISSGTVFVGQRLGSATALPQRDLAQCPSGHVCYPAEIGWYSMTALAGLAVFLVTIILRLGLLHLVRWRGKASDLCEQYDEVTAADRPERTYDIPGGCDSRHNPARHEFARKAASSRLFANITDDADWVVSAAVLTTLSLAVAVITSRFFEFLPDTREAAWFGFASWAIAFLVAGGAVVIYTARDNRQVRQTLGILWDVMSFFPRRFHPLAPPCYAEQSVIDVRNRLIHTTTRGAGSGKSDASSVILVAHSEGTLITTAALLSLLPRNIGTDPKLERHPGHPAPTGEELDHVAFVTYGCMLARLYSRAWPDQLPESSLVKLKVALEEPSTVHAAAGPFPCPPHDRIPRWVNFGRYTDYLGGRVFAELQRKPTKREPRPERQWTDGDLRCDDVFFIDPVRRWRYDGQLEFARKWLHSFDYESDTEDPRFREHVWFTARVFNGEGESIVAADYRRSENCACHPAVNEPAG